MMRSFVLVSLLVTAACGDNIKPPIPGQLSEGPVIIESDPLKLIVNADGNFESDRFVELGTVAEVDETRYYDPRVIGDAVTFERIERATGFDEVAGKLELETSDGQRALLGLRPGPEGSATITLEPVIDVEDPGGIVLARYRFPRVVDEAIFGFGESFGSAVGGGDVREMQLRVDGEWESGINEAHVPVPLTLWPGRGVGVFIEDERPAAYDIGASDPEVVFATFTQVEPGEMPAHVFTRSEPLDLSRAYAAMTGLPAVPPPWAFAPQQWRNEHENSDEVRLDANEMRNLGIPGSTIWIDNPWQTGYNTFEFDPNRFDGAQTLINDLTDLGYRVLVWSTPYVNEMGITSSDFATAAASDFLVTDDRDRPFVFPWQDGPGALVDFTRTGATEFWAERIARATALGIDGFKLDFGEDLVPELLGTISFFKLAAGTPQTLHSRYAEFYHRAYLDALPENDGFLITRAGAYGEQTVNTCIWPGDLDSDFSRHGVDNGDNQLNVGGLPAAISGMLSLSVSGYPFYGSDIGGFREGPPTTEVLIRWAQYAALGTIMQLGGGGDNHNPWDTTLYGPEALPIYQTYSRLHMDLFPTLYTLALRAGADGTPVTIPTRFLHPEAQSDDMTFFVGDALFVAPVITAGASMRQVILPPGEWVDFWSDNLLVGDGIIEEDVAAQLDILPLWQRLDTAIAMFALAADTLEPATIAGVDSYADPAFGRELLWRVTPSGAAISTGPIYDGADFNAVETAGEYVIDLTAGSQFDIFTIELHATSRAPAAVADPSAVIGDGNALQLVVLEGDLLICNPDPGCYRRDPATGVVRARTSATRVVVQPQP